MSPDVSQFAQSAPPHTAPVTFYAMRIISVISVGNRTDTI
jgi:hypothetical protein